ncbi:MAG: lysophospholipid acyltransferase family protein [Paramuribaculum sp.]|nr:lysophospholipid acyltransferase family protein [Paramuribaculum sp.]
MKPRNKYRLYMALFKPLSWLPLRMLYGISDMLRFLLQYVIKYRRKVVRENLTASLPDKSVSELRRIENQFYRQFADNIVETIKLLHISDRTINKRVKVLNSELVEDIARSGQPIMLYLGHYGNWEWVPAITLHFDEPKIAAQIYKAIHDEAFDKVMLRVRSRFKSQNIEQYSAMRTLLRFRRDYGTFIVGILDDHSPNHNRSAHYMPWLNHPYTIYNVGAEEIGRRLDAEFVYLDVEKPRRGHYTLTFKRIMPTETDTEYPYTREYMRMLEATIRRAPGYWLWSHKRWRYQPAEQTETEQ